MSERIVLVMAKVTQIRRGAKRHLYLTEWFEFRGLNDEKVAGRMDSNRETIWRYRNGKTRVAPHIQARLAEALDCAPADLWHLPGRPSIDAMLKDASKETHEIAVDIVQQLVKRR